ncbi:hypothetical protein [Streptomyces sp. 900105755]
MPFSSPSRAFSIWLTAWTYCVGPPGTASGLTPVALAAGPVPTGLVASSLSVAFSPST